MFYAGDALCTMAAAASTGSEVFMTDMTRGRLTFRQSNFAGNRYSDHVALLNAFQVIQHQCSQQILLVL